MILQKLDEELKKIGYMQVKSRFPEMNLYYLNFDGCARAVHVIHCHEQFFFDSVQLQKTIDSTEKMFLDKKYREVSSFVLVVADNIERARNICQITTPYWIIDERESRLLVYEDQPAEYFGLKNVVEGILQKDYFDHNRWSLTTLLRHWTLQELWVRFGVNGCIIAVNVIFFLLSLLIGPDIVMEYGSMDEGAIYHYREYYRLFTCMFIHSGISHLANNMLFLLIIGDNLERAVGKVRYLIIYFAAGIIGSLCSYWYALDSAVYIRSVGASGAIFGITGALFFMVLVHKGRLENVTLTRITLLILICLYNGFSSAGVDNAAHVGGLLGGIFITAVLYLLQNRKKVQIK